jgi:DNA helicase II / ATP-dependent DNA helicase PcrA
MDAWIDIRRKARACHQKALAKTAGDRSAAELIKAALDIDDLELRPIDLGPGTLGSLDRSARLISVAKSLDQATEHLVVAHEIGHFTLHDDPSNEVTGLQQGLGGDPVDSGAGKVEGYAPRERKEVQADVFAGEFLCPADWLREAYLREGKRPQELALVLGMPITLILNQMARALLLPSLSLAPAAQPGIVHELDDSQELAVAWDKGPLLVDAGPGTGKTRTLVHRVQRVLSKGSNPGSFLALTFSNKAAEEMRERLSGLVGDAAIEMWIGTFHAFGLELLRKWPSAVHRTTGLRVLDQTGALALLEENLDKLPLHHYQNLYEPAYELVNILKAISRCKDELISCDEYEAAAANALQNARDDDELEDAEKVMEIAKVYRIYEQALKDSDSVDFGDLVKLAVELVQNNQDVQNYVAGFKHVLVDEFQDVNSASATLLRAICKPDTDVWVVADPRQSIYRFRGAEPLNVSNFTSVFGGTRHALSNNYRSFAPIVRTFESFSKAMRGRGGHGSWNAIRSDGGHVSVTVAPTLSAEGEAIAEKISQLRQKGIPYRRQVILARSHLTLARITGILEHLGVPLLYLGDLFERPEIRDLLSLISIDAETGGSGLVRVSALPEYGVPRQDALQLIHWAQANRLSICEALLRCSEVKDLSEAGRAGLNKLGSQLTGLQKTSPLVLLNQWLFERSAYLSPLLQAGDAKSQQKLIAIYHLLKICGEYASGGETSRKGFLDRIRRIELLNQDTPYRAVSSEASDMDAVRVMTIHGSKGLEFPAVHFPALATGYMPSKRQAASFPVPPSLAHLSMQEDGHHAEEECLFFVGLSRARDHLSISRAERYTTRTANASKFLDSIGPVSATTFRGSGKEYSFPVTLEALGAKEIYPERDLDVYMQCPARYRYMVIDALRGGRDQSAYLRFHRSVYITIQWLEQERKEGRTVDKRDALSRLAEVWATDGPVDHGFESYYRSAAEAMVTGMANAMASETGQYDRKEWLIPIGRHKISITPDRVFISADGSIHVQRIRTGRQTKSEPKKPIYALLRKGAAIQYPGRRIHVGTFYLATNEAVLVPPQDDVKLIGEYQEAIQSIERGDFHAETDARRCPNCPSYFICVGKAG